MSKILYAVLVLRAEEGSFQVEHLYQRRADAEACAHAYGTQAGLAAVAARLAPALAVSRRADAWATLSAPEGGEPHLRLFASLETATAASLAPDGSLCLISAPILRGMPVQSGVPQFAATGGC